MAGAPRWCRYDAAAQRLSLTLHVQPGARSEGLAGLHGDALKVRIAAPAADNRANEALARLVSRLLDVSVSSVSISHGATGRRKVLVVVPVGAAALARLLDAAARTGASG